MRFDGDGNGRDTQDNEEFLDTAQEAGSGREQRDARHVHEDAI